MQLFLKPHDFICLCEIANLFKVLQTFKYNFDCILENWNNLCHKPLTTFVKYSMFDKVQNTPLTLVVIINMLTLLMRGYLFHQLVFSVSKNLQQLTLNNLVFRKLKTVNLAANHPAKLETLKIAAKKYAKADIKIF